MPSPHPIPSHLKSLRGNPGGRKPNSAEPKAPPGRPRCPAWLDAHGKQMFRQTAVHLEDLGILSHVDVAALTLLADVWSQYRKTRDWKLAMRVQSLLSEFGLTPSSRTKVRVEKKRDEPRRYIGAA